MKGRRRSENSKRKEEKKNKRNIFAIFLLLIASLRTRANFLYNTIQLNSSPNIACAWTHLKGETERRYFLPHNDLMNMKTKQRRRAGVIARTLSRRFKNLQFLSSFSGRNLLTMIRTSPSRYYTFHTYSNAESLVVVSSDLTKSRRGYAVVQLWISIFVHLIEFRNGCLRAHIDSAYLLSETKRKLVKLTPTKCTREIIPLNACHLPSCLAHSSHATHDP